MTREGELRIQELDKKYAIKMYNGIKIHFPQMNTVRVGGQTFTRT